MSHHQEEETKFETVFVVFMIVVFMLMKAIVTEVFTCSAISPFALLPIM